MAGEMPITHAMITVAGEVSLLLWGVHMVQRGVLRSYGTALRATLSVGLRHRVSAVFAGLGLTAAIQSSTATAMIAGSFVADGIIPLSTALAIMLGANVGSALIVKALSFDTTLIAPVLMTIGFIAFGRTAPRIRNLGRAMIGLGLVMLSLHMLVETATPTTIDPDERWLIARMIDDPIVLMVISAIFTTIAHSSVATVLIVMSLAGAGVVGPEAALALVLGANLGSAINPVLTFARKDRGAFRLALGNLCTRMVGCGATLSILSLLLEWLRILDPSPGQITANFHVAFNLAVALVFLVLVPLVARALMILVPDRPVPADRGTPEHLDPTSLADPTTALANAARETLRMISLVEEMLRRTHDVLHSNDRQRTGDIRRMDDDLDRLHAAIERYLVSIDAARLCDTDRDRLAAILTFSINLEHAGDVIERSLTAIVSKKIKGGLELAPTAMAQIDEMFAELLLELQLAAAVLIHGDATSARRLFEAKENFRTLEEQSKHGHFQRMRAGEVASLETSALVLDLMRDLKRIAGHIGATAEPLLIAHKILRSSRLVPMQ